MSGVLPIPVGERIVSHPFHHFGVVGGSSDRNICQVILDDALPHTNSVLSVWDEVQREHDYLLEEAQQRLDWAIQDRAEANELLRVSKARAENARMAIKEARAELRKVRNASWTNARVYR